MRLAVLVNPRAGAGRGARSAPVVLDLLRRAGHEVIEIAAPTAAGARERLDDVLDDPGAIEGVVSIGGDGGVHLALQAVRSVAPHVPIGLVPAGTGNDLARSLGLPPGDSAEAAVRLLAALRKPSQPLDVGRVRRLLPDGSLDQGTRPAWFLNVASAGINAAVNARANRMRWPHGSAKYVLGLAAELPSFRGYAVRAVADGVDLGDCGTIVAIGNAQSIGGGMRITPTANLDDGLLDVVVARTVSRTQLATVFPRVYRGTHVTHPIVRVVQARSINLLPDPDARGRAPAPLLHADGEQIGPLPVRVDVLPEAVGFFV
ncbi:diacylglycerol/lipid kinase family protein [Salana multivorans]